MILLESGFFDLLTNYTFRTMILGTGTVGAVAGLLGCLLYLRKQTMISDVIGHAAIGGVAEVRPVEVGEPEGTIVVSE